MRKATSKSTVKTYKHGGLGQKVTGQQGVEVKQPQAATPEPQPSLKREQHPLLELLNIKPGCFKSAEEIDAFIREERNAWRS